MRRFTRLTNAFSKKPANREAAVALHFMHYNSCRQHKTLRVALASLHLVNGDLLNIVETMDRYAFVGVGSLPLSISK